MTSGAQSELDVLQKDVGEWDGDITVTPQPGAPPQHSKGRLSGRLISGGKWLILDFKNHTTGFEGHGVYGYNKATQKYVGTWVDDARSDIYRAEGAWDASSRTMTYFWTATLPDGRTISWKETSETVSENEHVFRSFMNAPGGGEFEMMSARYTRAR